MTILSSDNIINMVKKDLLRIRPFNKTSVQPASYDLCLGKRVLISPIGKERGRAVDLDKEEEQKIAIKPGQFIAILTKEELELPNDVCARFGLKSNLARKGLMAFGGIQVDPGFIGRLAISLFNVGPESIELKLGEPLFTIEFERLETATTKPYNGEHQNQDDFPADQYNFILGAHTVSLAELPDLKREIWQINNRLAVIDILREDIGELLEDPDRELELKDEVKDRLKKCILLSNKDQKHHMAADIAKSLGLVW